MVSLLIIFLARDVILSRIFYFNKLEVDNTGVIEGDKDAPQEMGNPDAEVVEKKFKLKKSN